MDHETRERVGGWVVEFLTKIGREDLLDVIRVEWNKRFTARLGDAYYIAVPWDHPHVKPVTVIRFSIPLWPRASEEERRNTVAHELAHIVTWHNFYTARNEAIRASSISIVSYRKKPAPHGREWKRVMRKMGEEPRTTYSGIDRSDLVRKTRRTPGYCGCRVWELTKGRVNRIRKLHPRTAYRCSGCANPIRLKEAA